MNLFLFFDDKNLLVREDTERVLEKPQLLESDKYLDDKAVVSNAFPAIWHDKENKRYMMFYNGCVNGNGKYLCAVSDDGVHFKPFKNPNTWDAKVVDHEFMPSCGEFATVYVDEKAPKEERLKLLNARVDGSLERIVENNIYTSGDGINWKKSDYQWHNHGAEPGAFAFYNNVTNKHTIVARPDAGVRRVCLIETDDFTSFTDARLVMNPDSLDKPLAEHYGMPVFAYENYFIGFLWIYETLNIPERKYWGGTINGQITYSYNGTSFFRTIRDEFFANDTALTKGMTFPSSMYFAKDNSLIVMASATPHIHGEWKKEGGAIVPYKLRKDGFVSLKMGKNGKIVTGAMLNQGGELLLNIKGKATCAIYTDNSKNEKSNLLRHPLIPVEGFSHEDCIAFNGDSTEWKVEWKNRKFNDLKDEIIYIEIKGQDSNLYSIRANIVPMMICDLRRYHLYKTVPNIKGLL